MIADGNTETLLAQHDADDVAGCSFVDRHRRCEYVRYMTFAHHLRPHRAHESRGALFVRQTGRLISAVVRPSLWLLVFAAVSRMYLVAVVEPYETHIRYEVYMVPGLLGMVLLFNGMQSC